MTSPLIPIIVATAHDTTNQRGWCFFWHRVRRCLNWHALMSPVKHCAGQWRDSDFEAVFPLTVAVRQELVISTPLQSQLFPYCPSRQPPTVSPSSENCFPTPAKGVRSTLPSQLGKCPENTPVPGLKGFSSHATYLKFKLYSNSEGHAIVLSAGRPLKSQCYNDTGLSS